jgi:uncharacterized protein
MRLKESRVDLIARQIVDHLMKEELIECTSKDDLIVAMRQVIVDDLMVEDRLDEEVRILLRNHQGELDRQRLEFFNMFRLVKEKLVKERNIIL